MQIVILVEKKFPRISYDELFEIFSKNGCKYVTYRSYEEYTKLLRDLSADNTVLTYSNCRLKSCNSADNMSCEIVLLPRISRFNSIVFYNRETLEIAGDKIYFRENNSSRKKPIVSTCCSIVDYFNNLSKNILSITPLGITDELLMKVVQPPFISDLFTWYDKLKSIEFFEYDYALRKQRSELLKIMTTDYQEIIFREFIERILDDE